LKTYEVEVRKVICFNLNIEAEDYNDALEIADRRVCIDQDLTEEEINLGAFEEFYKIPDLC
jgi:hypothetical protein